MDKAFSILQAQVGHERLYPKKNKFVYSVFYVKIPITKKLSSPCPLFSFDTFNVLSIKTKMYGPKDGTSLYIWITNLAENHDITVSEDDTISLITHPRYFGFAFNPISYWMIHDSAGGLRAVLCEVRNTFGNDHNYFLYKKDGSCILPQDTLEADKSLFVSPFNPNEGSYTFQFTHNEVSFKSIINYYVDNKHTLNTYMGGTFSPLSSIRIIKSVVQYPLMTLKVVFLIHYQAVRLYIKGVRNTLSERHLDYTNRRTTRGK